jgi:hypothetical protein
LSLENEIDGERESLGISLATGTSFGDSLMVLCPKTSFNRLASVSTYSKELGIRNSLQRVVSVKIGLKMEFANFS